MSVSEKAQFGYVSITAAPFLLSPDNRGTRIFPGFDAPAESGYILIAQLEILGCPTGSRGLFRSGAVKNDFLVFGKFGKAGLEFF